MPVVIKEETFSLKAHFSYVLREIVKPELRIVHQSKSLRFVDNEERFVKAIYIILNILQ